MAFDRIRRAARTIRQGIKLARLTPRTPFSVADLIERQAAARPDQTFIRFEDRVDTYAEFNASANRVAHWAAGSGLREGDVVALLMQNRPAYLEIWAGLAKVGVTVALLNTHVTGRSLQRAILDAGARKLIVDTECLQNLGEAGDRIPGSPEILVSCERGEAEHAELFPTGGTDFERTLSGSPTADPDRALRAGVKAGDDLFFIYTSGTTGLPKAARFTHLHFMRASSLAPLAGFTSRDTMYCALPLYHTAGGAMAVGAALCEGGTLALRRKFSATHFWDDVRRFDATAFQYVGELCRYLLHQPARPDDREHGIRFAIGNGLRPDIWEEFRDRFAIPLIAEFYGATEGNFATLNLDGSVGSVGKLPPRILVDARLIQYDVERDYHPRDEQGHCTECGPGETGELIGRITARRSPFDGYTSREATEQKILRNVFADGDAFFRTGDLLRRDQGNALYFVDRIGDTFRWKGENVSTQEVAEVLAGFPGVEIVSVYGVTIEGADGRAGMAALVMSQGEPPDGAALYGFLARTLPSYAAPVFIRIQPEAEITATFKLRKVDLQRDGYDPAKVQDPLFIRDDAARSYVPLTPDRYRQVRSGSLKL